MALTQRYVRADAAGGGNGTTDANSGANGAYTLSEAVTAINGGEAAGYQFNIKAGAYSQSADDTITGDGTAAAPLVLKGFTTTSGDLDAQARVDGHEAWDTTNWPVITYAQGSRFNAGGADYLSISGIKFAVAGTGYSGAVVTLTNTSTLARCVVTNPSTNSGAAAVAAGLGIVFDCDINLTGASGGAYAITGNGRYLTNRISIDSSSTTVVGIAMTGGCTAIFNRFVKCAGIHFKGSGSSASTYTLLYNTCPTGAALIQVGNTAHTGLHCLVGNLLCNSGGYAIDSLYAGTANLAGLFAYNRFRDNTSGSINGFADWAAATSFGHVTTDDTDANEFIDLANGDLRLAKPSLCRRAGGAGYLDIGALQRAEDYPGTSSVLTTDTTDGAAGTFHAPDAAEVWHNATFGPASGTNGTKTAATLAVSGGRTGTLEAQDIVDGVIVDAGDNQIEGTATSGSADLPDPLMIGA